MSVRIPISRSSSRNGTGPNSNLKSVGDRALGHNGRVSRTTPEPLLTVNDSTILNFYAGGNESFKLRSSVNDYNTNKPELLGFEPPTNGTKVDGSSAIVKFPNNVLLWVAISKRRISSSHFFSNLITAMDVSPTFFLMLSVF